MGGINNLHHSNGLLAFLTVSLAKKKSRNGDSDKMNLFALDPKKQFIKRIGQLSFVLKPCPPAVSKTALERLL
jgi:hypothetical protein